LNFAFGVVLILFLLTPGIIFRIAFLKGPYARKYFRQSVADEVFYSLVPAVLFQLIGLICISQNYIIDYETLFYLLTNPPRNEHQIDFKIIQSSLPNFALYNFSLISASYILGYLLRKAISFLRLDVYLSFLKLNNEWYYILKGKILDTWDDPYASNAIDFIQIDLLVENGNNMFIYSGILEEFYLSENNGLDRLVLYNVYRRTLENDLPDDLKKQSSILDKGTDERYYNMPGDSFVVPYSEIKNMNITYLTLTKEESSESENIE
jgi:hypothetical protein